MKNPSQLFDFGSPDRPITGSPDSLIPLLPPFLCVSKVFCRELEIPQKQKSLDNASSRLKINRREKLMNTNQLGPAKSNFTTMVDSSAAGSYFHFITAETTA